MEAPGSDAVAPADAAAAAPAEEESPYVQGLAPGVELTPEELAELSKRQQAYLGLNPEKYKRFLPKLSRKELGSYADEEFLEAYEEELEMYPKIPDNVPLYNPRQVVPELKEPKCELLDKMMTIRMENPGMTLEELMEGMGYPEGDIEPPHPGARPILRWETQLVMAVGVNEAHPANSKVRLRVFLKDLQREAGLSEAALQYVARICGPRYNPRKGEVLLTSEKYSLREDNRRHCMEMLVALVEEGQRAYPLPNGQQQQQQVAGVAADGYSSSGSSSSDSGSGSSSRSEDSSSSSGESSSGGGPAAVAGAI